MTWQHNGHQVEAVGVSRVSTIWIVGVSDPLQQQAVCDFYFPPDPLFQKQVGNTYYYSASSGVFSMTVVNDGCTIQS